MCGIFFSLSRRGFVSPDANTEQLLRNRGPDSIGRHQISIPPEAKHDASRALHATFISTVLSLRGTTVVDQPLRDEASGSVLCWNGEAWSIRGERVSGNDSRAVLQSLLQCSANGDRSTSLARVVDFMSSIQGPYAFAFYDARNRYLFYGRDCLGRRSLLRKHSADQELILSSVCDNSTGLQWAEVEADGMYILDLACASTGPSFDIIHIPQRRKNVVSEGLAFSLPFPALNEDSGGAISHPDTETIHRLTESLRDSLEMRIQHVREAVPSPVGDGSDQEARIAILFSGGLDCTILARISHDLLPLDQSIDLLNVAFQNPRIHSKLDPSVSPYELCPDRITGRSSHAELENICPGRLWRFVAINVPYTDTVAYRNKVMTLMHPHNTEMDLSISYALYFASRGAGLARNLPDASPTSYTTSAHVLISGLGADELFGGYGRHEVAFARQGYPGLIEELKLDFDRLGKRNLGRDDRVISDSGKEVRFPYLDERFTALALELPVHDKCDFANTQIADSDDPARFLEPCKRALRLLAWRLGMKHVATEKKRAIQFGARTAKMETGKTKGTQVLS